MSDRVSVRKDRRIRVTRHSADREVGPGWIVTWDLSWSWHPTWESAMHTANYWAKRLL